MAFKAEKAPTLKERRRLRKGLMEDTDPRREWVSTMSTNLKKIPEDPIEEQMNLSRYAQRR